MRNGDRVFGPDELKVLSQIVTWACQKLRSVPHYRGLDHNALREKVAKQAIAYAGNDLLDVIAIRQKIIAAWSNHHGNG
jgi:hypothetical protein